MAKLPITFTVTLTVVLLLSSLLVAHAQEETPLPTAPAGLTVQDVDIVEQQDIYGQTVQVAAGHLVNESDTAYTNVSLNALLYNEADEQIGEGIGYLVDACAAGLLPSFSLQPDHTQPFTIPLELYEQDAAIDRIEVVPLAQETEPLDRSSSTLHDGIEQVTDQEVVEVEWTGPRTLRYAVGCNRNLFTEWSWNNYNTLTSAIRPTEHPNAANVTDGLREALRLTDPLIFESSLLQFAPSGTRLVYQDAVNRFYTAAADGTLQRLVHSSGLNNRTLQGIYWLEDNRFLAYYFGAYGDPVNYFTADAEGRQISPAPLNNPESVIVPGATRDARRVVVAGNFDEGLGYYLHVVTNGFFERLFAAEPPGNNWPSPIPTVNPEDDLVTRIYIARPVNGHSVLECYNRTQDVLYELAQLPLNLSEGDRAQWWLSPDDRTIALAANGINGGLWLIDLNALPPCE